MRLAPFKSFGRLYILIYFLTFLQTVYSQTELPIDEDPYLDPDGIKALSSNQGFSENQGILIGILYGLHPALVFSPALSLGYYNEPFAVGIEISDDVFYKVIEDGNYMGDELCKYFMDNHLDVRWILQMVKLYERISK